MSRVAGALREYGFRIGCAVVAAAFAAGGWYIWQHADAAGAPASSPATVSSAEVQAAAAARLDGKPGIPRVMLVGNSVAFDLASGFKASGRATPLNAAIVGCSFPPAIASLNVNPLTHATSADRPCHPQGEAAELAAFRPNIVLWVVGDKPGPYTYQGRSVQPCAQPYDSLYTRALEREITRMKHGGAKVVITSEAYVRFTIPGDGASALPLPDRTADCNNALRRAVAAKEHVQLVDLMGYTCPNGTCPARRDGVVLRLDGLHYSGAGAVLAARWILDQVGT